MQFHSYIMIYFTFYVYILLPSTCKCSKKQCDPFEKCKMPALGPLKKKCVANGTLSTTKNVVYLVTGGSKNMIIIQRKIGEFAFFRGALVRLRISATALSV